ncbi:DUF3037 domain-containing protein [Clostridium estertheticum]|uniref:DUF3037 domain-containing protein n=1 Tax=Clostridium estertheticum TaxID=238834 RepID=UPI001CF33CB0|nr:DUF3037 domain-containing protein [Clostridium estertheticum]MCB2354365.1 DUF3037 domain-containing protein [Clostridium estertheticum]WAG42516.1 DUF3037 domain-containing protein [Clostridium estertheticum]
MINIQYSVLCHYPSIVSRDCITLGVLIYNTDEKSIIFETIKNWQRVRSFNDELDVELIKVQLEGIEEEVSELCKHKSFNLADYTRFYIGEVKFTEVINLVAEDFEEFRAECKRQYLICDVDKAERPSTADQLKFIRNTLKNSKVVYKTGNITGYFNENVNFDFIIGNYAIKIFSFEGKNEKRLVKNVKDWAYDAYKLKDKYKIIFATDINPEHQKEYKVIYKILEEECYKILTLADIIPFVSRINNEQVVV